MSNVRFINVKIMLQIMNQKMIEIPKQEYESLLEEVGILRNKHMMEAIKESDEAKKKGIRTWEIKIHR